MKIILIGIQGSGKSTQGKLLAKKLSIPYLSTGDIFRQLAKEDTPQGRYIKETINKGVLVPDEKVVPIILKYLSKPEYQKGYILDGFPRTVNQAATFGDNIDLVFYLKVADKETLKRLAGRQDAFRGDETEAATKKRIDLFYKLTKPMVNYYRKKDKLIEIKAQRSISLINQQLLEHMKSPRAEPDTRRYLAEPVVSSGYGGFHPPKQKEHPHSSTVKTCGFLRRRINKTR